MLSATRITLLLCLAMATGCSSLRQALKNRPCVLEPGQPYDVLVVDPDVHSIRLYWKDPNGHPFLTLGAVEDWILAQGDSLVALTNGGIYEPGYVPTGLFIDKGQIAVPLNLRDGEGNFYLKPNGIFTLTRQGARIVESSVFDAKEDAVIYALQSGPLLVSDGDIHPAFQDGSRNCRLRSGIGVRADGTIVLAITNGAANFHDFATLFRDRLGCPNALYLDGAISTLHAPALGRFERTRRRYAGILAVLVRNKTNSP